MTCCRFDVNSKPFIWRYLKKSEDIRWHIERVIHLTLDRPFFFWCIVSKWAINSAGHGGTFTNHLVWVENLRVRRTPLSIVRKIVRADLMKGNVPLCYDWAKTGLIFSINIIANFCLSSSKPIFRGLVNDLFQFLVSSNFTNFHSVFQLGSHGLKILLLVLYNYPVGPICPNLASYIIKTIQKRIWIRKKSW